MQVQVCSPTAGDLCDGGISVLYNCLSWYKFVNTHLYHSRQLYNIHLYCCVDTVCNFGQDWEVGYLTGVHTQYKALLPQEITATVGVRIGLRSVNITLLGKEPRLDIHVHMEFLARLCYEHDVRPSVCNA